MGTPAAVNRQSFAAFGSVHPARAGPAEDEAEALVALARSLLGPELEELRSRREASPPTAIVEAHPGSAQLTMTLDAPWIVRVVDPGVRPNAFGAAFREFLVPARPIAISPGIWHAPVHVTGLTEVVTIFRAGTSSGGTDWLERSLPVIAGPETSPDPTGS